jgi:putative ABC transport system permease protein
MKSPIRLIPSLAASHLCHEWILTLCLVIALAAVIAPLLVLLGLKHGTIQTLRDRLVEDPVFREIRPARTREFKPDWFKGLTGRPDIAFLTPTILPLSSVVSVQMTGTGRSELLDLVPTAPGDPLLLENRGTIPLEGEVVLTAEAAGMCNAAAGEEITVRVSRTRGGRTEQAGATLRVAAVLDARAGSLARIFAPLDFVLDVEGYKEGYGAPHRGWAGSSPRPYPSFDGAVLALSAPLPPITRTGLIINTGFGRISELAPDRASDLLGFAPPETTALYELTAPGGTVTATNLATIDRKLRGRTRVLLPYARDPVLQLPSGKQVRPVGLSLRPEHSGLLGLPPTPWESSLPGRRAAQGPPLHCLWPEEDPRKPGSGITVTSRGAADLSFELTVAGTTTLSRPVIPADLLGMLHTAAGRAVSFDPGTKQFAMARGGYRGFRLYARSIDDVPRLVRDLEDQGIEVVAEEEAILRIQTLDRGLTRLFRLIALLGVFGGTAVLVASLYAAVERRRRDLGVLRLLGFARSHVFFFPVAQGIIIAVLGLGAGLAGYGVLAATIDRTFTAELAAGEAFCTLPPAYVPLFFLLTVALAAVASLAAAWRATRIDPAEAIRDQ